MRTSLRHAGHVLRVLSLFGGGFVVFLFARWILVPADFGAFGFYRGGALAELRAQTPQHAGEQPCLDCHSDVGEVRAKAKHKIVHCEACHGPLALHATGDFTVKPRALNPRLLCLTCHTAGTGKPVSFPQVVPDDHASDGPCTDCHKPHMPRIE